MLCHIPHFLSEESEWVVFLHGLGGNSNIYYKQVEAFKPHYNLMFIDLFGHGCTLEQLNAYTFETLASAAVAVFDAEGIESAHLVGVSLGTIVMEAFSLLAPDRLKTMILSGAAEGYDLRSRTLLRLGGVLEYVMPYMLLYRLFAYIMMPRKNHTASRRIFIREARKLGGHEFKKWYRLMASLEPFYASVQERPQKIIPRLYISGDEDYLFMPFVIKNHLNESFSAIHIIEKCGHVCNIEQADRFNQVALAYLGQYPDPPADKHIPAGTRACRIARTIKFSGNNATTMKN